MHETVERGRFHIEIVKNEGFGVLLAIHSFQVMHFKSFNVNSCQFIHGNSFVSIHAFQFLHFNSFISLDSCHFMHFMHLTSFQLTSSQLTMN